MFKKNKNDFLSSSFLNIAGGLFTGFVITVWSQINDKIKESEQRKKQEMWKKLQNCQVGEFKLLEWEYSGFPYEIYDKLSFYTDEIRRFIHQCEESKDTIKKISEYFQHEKRVVALSQDLLIEDINIQIREYNSFLNEIIAILCNFYILS